MTSEPRTGSRGPHHKKSFFPLESDPELFTKLIHDLGVSSSLAFYDVLSIDDAELLSMIPRPVHALVLVFITSGTYLKEIEDEEASREHYNGSGEDEPVLWYKQTIHNACGLYGILHAVSNGTAREFVKDDSIMGCILKDAVPRAPNERCLLLEENSALEQAHTAIALQGQSTLGETPEEEVDNHYTCFVRSHKNGHLYELDGDKKGPIDLGHALGEDEDILSPAALKAVRKYLQRDQYLQFSLLALADRQEMVR